MGITEQLARFNVELKFQALPPETVKCAKELMLHCLAGTLAGATEPVSHMVIEYVRESGGNPDAGIVAAGFRSSVDNAALALGTFGHAAELEDDSLPGGVGTMTVLSAVLPLADKLRLSGKDVIEAFAAGIEVQSRIAFAGDPQVVQRGHCPIPFHGVFGAAAGAAKALRLDVQQTRMALSLAASQSSGIFIQTGSMAHLLESGFAARGGVTAAALAQKGATGHLDIIETARGGWAKILGLPETSLERITRGLGAPPFAVHRVAVKKYPCCLIIQRAIDALLSLIEEHELEEADVNLIEVEVNPAEAAICGRPNPKDEDDSRFSFQHALAAVLVDGDVGLATFTSEKLGDSRFAEARKLVNIVPCSEWLAKAFAGICRVTVHLKDGRVLSTERSAAIGFPASPLTTEQHIHLFKKCAQRVLSDSQAQRTINMVLNLEQFEDLAELSNILTSAKLIRQV